MRKIKFRAWDKKEKRWVSNNIAISGDGCLLWQFGYTLKIINKADYEIGFYTGLRDKNGKEIYEGDIFNSKRDKSAEGGGWIGGTFGYHPENSVVVEFRGGAFMVGHETLKTYLAFHSVPGHNVDLIGNIHETPELLEAK